MAVASLGSAPEAQGQRLTLPERPTGAIDGAEFARGLRALDRAAREERIYHEIASGNVPTWMRTLAPVRTTRTLEGRERVVTFWVTPDYLAVGSDDDYFRTPLTPGTAQRVADLVNGSLPTTVIVDAVWASADVRLGPDSIPPGPAMITVPVFEDHERMVQARRNRHSEPGGALVAGHKKDVVLTPRLDSLPGRVAIYGWHRPDGRPIQPLYAGHTDDWADYSHGIRLVARRVLIDGEEHDLLDLLRDPRLAPLLSPEGAMVSARYPVVPG